MKSNISLTPSSDAINGTIVQIGLSTEADDVFAQQDNLLDWLHAAPALTTLDVELLSSVDGASVGASDEMSFIGDVADDILETYTSHNENISTPPSFDTYALAIWPELTTDSSLNLTEFLQNTDMQAMQEFHPIPDFSARSDSLAEIFSYIDISAPVSLSAPETQVLSTTAQHSMSAEFSTSVSQMYTSLVLDELSPLQKAMEGSGTDV